MFSMLQNREIIVGITGGIAAYKSVELVRALTKKGASVHVVMTRNATEFVTPLTFQTISGHPVTQEVFQLWTGGKIGHIALADIADQMVIAPATANIIGKIANGIADDFLTTMVMATTVPVLFVPSMNTKMWESTIVQSNIEKLKSNGYEFMEPASGDLACGWQGKGRLPTVEDIVERMEDIFTQKDLLNERVLVTAGPTTEFIDPVRCITNRSSGKMGYAIAKIARRRGADVVLVSGSTALEPPRGDIRVINVTTAEEMRNAVLDEYERCSIIIKAAAVSDYRCKSESCEKIKKKEGQEEITLTLKKNPDILAELGQMGGERVLVGFAAETHYVEKHAYDKLRRKNLDLIVANDVTKAGIGFGSDNNEVTIIDSSGVSKHVPKLSKEEIAHIILDAVLRVMKNKRKEKDDWL
jgi:phosphopantothenoylcysteine decarboxylase / phosphopantothenate---cysteine ligase